MQLRECRVRGENVGRNQRRNEEAEDIPAVSYYVNAFTEKDLIHIFNTDFIVNFLSMLILRCIFPSTSAFAVFQEWKLIILVTSEPSNGHAFEEDRS